MGQGITPEGRGRGARHSLAPQAPMTPISRVNRDIFHDIARRKGARASRFRHPFSPSVLTPPPSAAPSSSTLSFSLSATATQHSADLPEVDEKFSELLSRELSRRAPTTSRKFRDVNAIARRTAENPLAGFAYLLGRASREFIGHRFANRPGRHRGDSRYIRRIHYYFIETV